ncbi:MAG TPA: alpha/beta fold hydrolase [Streptosporangiaceae bacterium]|nr:alpha/beta fold hydrolase [Streptosporangiaceae bacterium]
MLAVHHMDGATVDKALRRVEKLNAVCVLLASLEFLARPEVLRDDHVLSWPIARDSYPRQWQRPPKVLDAVWSYPGVLGVHAFRGAAAARLLLDGRDARPRPLLSAGLAVASVGVHARSGYGLDGSDHMSTLNSVVLALARLFPDDAEAREACLWFIVSQACLSYTVSGLVKVASPVWRSGEALPGVLRTETYGDRRFHDFLKKRPVLSKWVSRGMVAGETLFPLVVGAAPSPAVTRAHLAAGGVFHAANARFMGLNRFFWAFVATYPALGAAVGQIRSAPPAPQAPLGAGAKLSQLGRGLPTVPRLACGAIAATAVTGAVYQVAGARKDRRRFPPPGVRVDVGGHRLHVLARGEDRGRPAVVFEHGLGAAALSWAWVQRAVAERTRTVACDRAGCGWSEAGPKPASARQSVSHLRTVLAAVGVAGPYVLVGHSLGGLLVRFFAAQHPDEVVGMVLVDSSHPGELQRDREVREGVVWLEETMRHNVLYASFGMVRKWPGGGPVVQLPAAEAAAARAMMATPRYWLEARAELAAWKDTICAEVAACRLPDGLPLAVVTAGNTLDNNTTHAELQAELAALSANSMHVVVEGAGHDEVIMNEKYAATVADVVGRVVDSAANGTPLHPPVEAGRGTAAAKAAKS